MQQWVQLYRPKAVMPTWGSRGICLWHVDVRSRLACSLWYESLELLAIAGCSLSCLFPGQGRKASGHHFPLCLLPQSDCHQLSEHDLFEQTLRMACFHHQHTEVMVDWSLQVHFTSCKPRAKGAFLSRFVSVLDTGHDGSVANSRSKGGLKLSLLSPMQRLMSAYFCGAASSVAQVRVFKSSIYPTPNEAASLSDVLSRRKASGELLFWLARLYSPEDDSSA